MNDNRFDFNPQLRAMRDACLALVEDARTFFGSMTCDEIYIPSTWSEDILERFKKDYSEIMDGDEYKDGDVVSAAIVMSICAKWLRSLPIENPNTERPSP